eukprot:19813-Rhodomonas_salina.1
MQDSRRTPSTEQTQRQAQTDRQREERRGGQTGFSLRNIGNLSSSSRPKLLLLSLNERDALSPLPPLALRPDAYSSVIATCAFPCPKVQGQSLSSSSDSLPSNERKMV